MNYSGLSDADLKAYGEKNYSAMSDAGVKYIHDQINPPAKVSAPASSQFSKNHPLLNVLGRGAADVGGHALADVADIGRDILNVPHNINQNIPSYLGLIPKFAQGEDDNFQALGVKKNPVDEIAQTAVESAPFFGAARGVVGASELLSKAPALATNMLGGAGFGAATNLQHPAQGAAEGAAIGGVSTPAGKIADKFLVKPISSFISNEAIKPLAKYATSLQSKERLPDGAIGKMVQDAHDVEKKDNDAKWDVTNGYADKLDDIQSKLPNNKFNASPYNKHISDFEAKYNSLEPALQTPYQSIMDVLPHLKNISPQSFKGAVQVRKNLNSSIDQYANSRDISLQKTKEFNNFVGGLKNKVVESTQKNTPAFAKNISDGFQNSWEDANQQYQKLQDFYEAPNKYGNADTNYRLEDVLKNKDVTPDDAILKHFLPQPGQTGTHGFDALSNLIGKDNAQKAVKSYMTRGINNGNAADAVNMYKGLSGAQRDAMFGGTKYGQLLDKATKIKETMDKKARYAPLLHGLGAFGVPGGLAFGAGELGGLGTPDSAALAVGVGGTALGSGRSIAELTPRFPGIAEKALNLAENGRQSIGRKSQLLALSALQNKNKQEQDKPLQITINKGLGR